jgi:dynein heavy chain, axonemal
VNPKARTFANLRCRAAGAPHPLAGLADSIASDSDGWRDWFELEAPEAAQPPGALAAALPPFERLLLLRCLRVDRVTVGVTRWVMGELGERYVTPPVSGCMNSTT